MGGFDKIVNALSERRFAKWCSLLGAYVLAYTLTSALFHRVLHLGLDYTIPLAASAGLIILVLLYGWMVARPKPAKPLPPLSIVLEPNMAMPLHAGDADGKVLAPSLACRFFVTNNQERPVKILYARLQSANKPGAAEMFSGETRLSDPDNYNANMPRVGEIAHDHTEMVFCNFNTDVTELAELDEYRDVVELIDHDGNTYLYEVPFRRPKQLSS